MAGVKHPMRSYQDLTKDELKDLLNANWMTHDAMWLVGSLKQYGMKQTNVVNKQAVREMARLEARRLQKLLGVKSISNFGDLKQFILTGFEIIRGSFMKFELEFDDDHLIRWDIPRCFAYEGVKRLGVIDEYDCGIVDRLLGWLDAVGADYTLRPAFSGCLKHQTGTCSMEIEVNFKAHTI